MKGTQDMPPRRRLAKAGMANGWSDHTVEERQETGLQKTIIEEMDRSFQAVILRPSAADAEWSSIDLPHDWRLGMTPSPDHQHPEDEAKVWQGFFPTGVTYYHKLLSLDRGPLGQRTSITFDGIAGFSDVWFNGFWVGEMASSYSPLTVDVTEILRAGDEGPNVVLVEVLNESPDEAKAGLVTVVKDPETGQEIACTDADSRVSVFSCGMVALATEVQISNPKLWQLGKGGLYTPEAHVVDAQGALLDVISTHFGVRTISWAKDGILGNGQWTKIVGANLHRDRSVFGVALPDRVIEQKLELCAELGVNAIRSAHHAPTQKLVDHAERMGMLLLLENRQLSTASSSLEQLRSLGDGPGILTRMVKEIKSLGPDRDTIFGGVMALDDKSYYSITDVVGMHYRSFFGVLDVAVGYVQDKPHVLDEESLYASVRGVYQYDKERAHAGSFSYLGEVMMDTPEPASNAALMPPDFNITGSIALDLTTAYTHPKVSGTFVWTALDYIGEPTLPKDYYWLLRSLFRRDEPLVHAFPHWTWPGREGESIPFRPYSNCDEVEFLVDDVVLAHERVNTGLVMIPDGIKYAPGKLVATFTAQKPARLMVDTDRSVLSVSSGDSIDVAFLRIAVTDEQGNLIPNAANHVKVAVKGEGYLRGTHNGDPSTDNYTCCETFQAFNGFIGAYFASDSSPGVMTVSVASDGLVGVEVDISVSTEDAWHLVHVAKDEAKNIII
ncbi:hypothetical protein CEP54_015595 [Fusarium duplospermum]|uniref:Beta-galactosidase n=1 Tax=Fusarium duplospermum TaxID=1325734 RepID=A0A428NMV3_9HYPO|nr:hypothetical protein CEP54_015595 [Fusarium duplospermum]